MKISRYIRYGEILLSVTIAATVRKEDVPGTPIKAALSMSIVRAMVALSAVVLAASCADFSRGST